GIMLSISSSQIKVGNLILDNGLQASQNQIKSLAENINYSF
ncbi:MAG: hypothetical protein ACI9DQ_001678, partial [Glaciecola sp.]